ncbi:unnamed protein product, partial [Lymnaea stagnalis]
RENTHFLPVLGGSIQQMSVPEPLDRMYFSVFGKHISITIPRNNPPVENGRGVTWENTVATTPNFNFTFRNFVSWCHLLFSRGGKALLSANSLKQPERSIVLERNDGDGDELLGQEPQGILRTSLASDRAGVECRSAEDFTLLDTRNWFTALPGIESNHFKSSCSYSV